MFKAPKTIINHPGVAECIAPDGAFDEDDGFKFDVLLKDGWTFYRLDDIRRSARFRSVKDFQNADPVFLTEYLRRRGFKPNREQIIERVQAEPDTVFQEEVEHKLHGIDDREYAYDEVSALFDIERQAENWVGEGHEGARKLWNVCTQILIEIGYYRPMTQEDIDNTITFSTAGGRSNPWIFKKGGVAYELDDEFNVEQFPDDEEE